MTDAEEAARRARIAELQGRRSASARAAGSRTASGAAGGAPTASNAAGSPPVATAPPAVSGHAPSAPRASARSPRAGAATGSKIAAAGMGFAAMLSLVAAMGYAGRSAASAPPASAPSAPAPVMVVIHPADGTAAPAKTAVTPGAASAALRQPISLSAQPTVRQAPASPAPTGRTNGSR
ncbi:MAG: hypothetical protein GX868_03195 [Actinobacteria bacterium]|nr:hypothetical protein [Actinomycetota bacterium]